MKISAIITFIKENCMIDELQGALTEFVTKTQDKNLFTQELMERAREVVEAAQKEFDVFKGELDWQLDSVEISDTDYERELEAGLQATVRVVKERLEALLSKSDNT
jgi:hypothetical protein